LGAPRLRVYLVSGGKSPSSDPGLSLGPGGAGVGPPLATAG